MSEVTKHDVKLLVLGIEDELARTEHMWKTCLNIFDHGVERAMLILDIDDEFFMELFEMYLETVTLSYNRLLDEHTSQGKYPNLSFSYLIEKSPLSELPKRSIWLADLQAIKTGRAVQKLRVARNKSIAHADLQTFLSTGFLSGGGIPKDDVAEIHSSLCRLLNEFKEALKISAPIDPHREKSRRYGSRLMQRLERK